MFFYTKIIKVDSKRGDTIDSTSNAIVPEEFTEIGDIPLANTKIRIDFSLTDDSLNLIDFNDK